MRHTPATVRPVAVKFVAVTLRRDVAQQHQRSSSATSYRRLSIITRSVMATVLTLLMCSCQSVTTRPTPATPAPKPAAEIHKAPVKSEPAWSSTPPSIPEEVLMAPSNSVAACPNCPVGHASLPPGAYGPCSPPVMLAPIEEYVCNGGDQNVHVQVKRDWSVQGLHPGDTVVHYDTLDGKTRIEKSNEVCLYAPRFAAVRKVYGIVAHEQHDRIAGVEKPVGVEQSSDLGLPTTVVQPLQPIRRHAVTGMQTFLEKTRGIGVDNAQRPAITEEQFLPFEDLAIIRRGVFDNTEKARLAERLQAAIAWTHNQAPQVLIDNRMAVEDVGVRSAESVYIYEVRGKGRLRVVKIASRQNAKPGELVEFTLRFDNVGDQPIGNVTVIDQLHDRLEYVPDSQNCSLKAEFSATDEEGSRQILRWEITDPMKVGEGGLIRFTCRVR